MNLLKRFNRYRHRHMLKKTGGRGRYSHRNSKGITYHLNVKDVPLRGGKLVPIYYFTKDFRQETSTDCPGNLVVNENSRNGFLTLHKASSSKEEPN